MNPDGTVATPGVFQRAQDEIIVGQSAYDEAYGVTFPTVAPYWGYSGIFNQDLKFTSPTLPCQDPTDAACQISLPMGQKAIQDEMGETFDEYGRMKSSLGLTLALGQAPAGNNFLMLGYRDAPTELIKLSRVEQPLGNTVAGDGTQIWKITHNGVDTHPVHFHLFHVQLVNRVGWDNNIRLPHPTELGWKDTVRISPLEDTIVALRPIAPVPYTVPPAGQAPPPNMLPFPLPNSIRRLEPALPAGVTWAVTDRFGNPTTITNNLTNFGWEYIWHCHILSHEENDMMRGIAFAVPPLAPVAGTSSLVGNGNNQRVRISWTNPFVGDRTGYEIQRSLGQDFASYVTFTVPSATATSFTDNTSNRTTPYAYRVRAINTVGATPGTAPGFPSLTVEGAWSAPILRLSPPATAPVAPAMPSTFTASARVVRRSVTVELAWTGVPGATGYTIQRATNQQFTGASTFTASATATTLTQTGLTRQTTYYYRIRSNGNGGSVFSDWKTATPFPVMAQ
jgi:hypothetical protein